MTALTAFLGKAAFGKHAGPEVQLPLMDQLVGLELEVDRDAGQAEGTVFPTNYRPQWDQKRDGSLANGYEYVLATPLAGQDLADAVHQLFSGGAQIFRTYTGSTHIHLNMLDGTTIENLQALALLTYAVEGLLYYVGDNSRQWCGFANRMTGAPHAVLENILGPTVDRQGLRRALNNAGRYYGLNLAALDKYGTVEFRYFPTATSPEEMLSWVKLVQQIKKAACDFGNVANVLEVLSDKSKYAEFVQTYLPEYVEEVEASCPFAKVKILANKALVIASLPRSTKANWDKKTLEEVYFAKPKLTVVPTLKPKDVLFLDHPSGARRLETAGEVARRAMEQGKEAVLLNYEGSIYFAWSYTMQTTGRVVLDASYSYDWLPLYELGRMGLNEEYERFILAAQEAGVSAKHIATSRKYLSGKSSSVRHQRFVPFAQANAVEDYDEPEDADYEDSDDEGDY